jgi:hypothetical protein
MPILFSYGEVGSMVSIMEAIENSERTPLALEQQWLMDSHKSCSVEDCQTPALVVLGLKPLCLNHFILRCYEWLDYLDPMIRSRICATPELTRIQALVEECSNRTLLVSLRCEELSNLHRSRLLDILLLSSDLLFILRLPRSEPGPMLSFRSKPRNRAAAPAPMNKTVSAQ